MLVGESSQYRTRPIHFVGFPEAARTISLSLLHTPTVKFSLTLADNPLSNKALIIRCRRSATRQISLLVPTFLFRLRTHRHLAWSRITVSVWMVGSVLARARI